LSIEERELNSSSPELFADEECEEKEEKIKVQHEDSEDIVDERPQHREKRKSEETVLVKEEVKRNHSPEQNGVVTKRRRVSRMKGAHCTDTHMELVKEGADLSCLRAQDLVQGSYTLKNSDQGPSLQQANTMTVVDGFELACSKCGTRIGEMMFEIRAEETIARVRLDE